MNQPHVLRMPDGPAQPSHSPHLRPELALPLSHCPMLFPGLPQASLAFLLHAFQLSMPRSMTTWSCHCLSLPHPCPLAGPHLPSLISTPHLSLPKPPCSSCLPLAWGALIPTPPLPVFGSFLSLFQSFLQRGLPSSPLAEQPTSSLGPSGIWDYRFSLCFPWQQPLGLWLIQQPRAQHSASTKRPRASCRVNEHTTNGYL